MSSDHLIAYVMLLDLKIKSQNTLPWKWFINLSAKTRHFLVLECEHLRKTILNKKNLKLTRKDATAIGKHFQCFSLAGNAANMFHLKLKESLLILKLKQSFNLVRESMPLQIYVITNISVWVYQCDVITVTNCVLTVQFKYLY